MSILIDCLDGLTMRDILRVTAKTGNGQPFYLQTMGAGLVLGAEFQAVYDSWAVKPSNADAVQMNAMVQKMVDDGVWAKLDIFHVFAVHSQAESLTNWINPGTFDATNVDATAWVAFEGYTGDGVNDYLDSHYNPNLDGINLALNDACGFFYNRVSSAANSWDFGSTNAAITQGFILRARDAATINSACNSGFGATQAIADDLGMIGMSRDNAVNYETYKNKVSATTITASTVIPSWDIFYLTISLEGVLFLPSTRQLSCGGAGGALTVAEWENHVDAFEAWMDFKGKGVIFCDEFQAVYDSWAAKPSDADAIQMNIMVQKMIDDGVWAKKDVFYNFAVHSQAESLTNWINPGTNDATNVHATAWVAFEGYTSDGVNDYLNTNYTPSVDATNFTQNSASMGCYIRSNIAEAKVDFGTKPNAGDFVDSSMLLARYTADAIITRMNSSDNTNVATTTDSRGLWVVGRNSASNLDVWRNKVLIDNNPSATSTGLSNREIYILGWNQNGVAQEFTVRQQSMFFAGGSFSQTNVDDETDAFEAWMDYKGKGVIP